MKNTLLKLLLVAFAASPIFISIVLLQNDTRKQSFDQKIYVALEGEGRIAVVSPQNNKLIKSIDLSGLQDGQFVKYSAHNVQVSPDGSKVIVTANVVRGEMGKEQEEEENIIDGLEDRVFIIDPLTDEIVYSIPLGVDLHLAHVVANTSGDTAYVTAQETGKLFVLDLNEKKVLSSFDLDEGSQPHGLRLSPDNSKVFIALIEGHAIVALDLASGVIKNYPLSGKVVQTAVTPDGNYVFASVYDSKQIGWVNLKTNEQGYVTLPSEAKGAVQLYPSPDSQYLYIADQGYYFDQPTSNHVYRLAIDTKQVDQTIIAGEAPHGVIVDKNGAFAYVTNLLSKDISVIDLSSNREVERISVGKMPNGISIWDKDKGGTP